MKHTIRQHGQLTQIDCELGSGMIDKNGREIIEGDIVERRNPNGKILTKGKVDIFLGSFYFDGCLLSAFMTSELEVVGHVGEE